MWARGPGILVREQRVQWALKARPEGPRVDQGHAEPRLPLVPTLGADGGLVRLRRR